MTQKVQMVSLTAHRYGRDELVKGDPFEAHPRDVKLLKALGRAEEREEETVNQPASAQVESRQMKPQQNARSPATSKKPSNNRQQSRRQYNRRDMKAKR